jgi:hypothetical protein
MVRHEGTQISFTMALLGGLYVDIIMVRHEGPQTALTIALLVGL